MNKSLKLAIYFYLVFLFQNFCLSHKKDARVASEMDSDFFDQAHQEFKDKMGLVRAQQEILEDQERVYLLNDKDLNHLQALKKDALKATALIRESIEKDEASSLIDLAFKIKEAINVLPDVVRHNPER